MFYLSPPYDSPYVSQAYDIDNDSYTVTVKPPTGYDSHIHLEIGRGSKLMRIYHLPLIQSSLKKSPTGYDSHKHLEVLYNQ